MESTRDPLHPDPPPTQAPAEQAPQVGHHPEPPGGAGRQVGVCSCSWGGGTMNPGKCQRGRGRGALSGAGLGGASGTGKGVARAQTTRADLPLRLLLTVQTSRGVMAALSFRGWESDLAAASGKSFSGTGINRFRKGCRSLPHPPPGPTRTAARMQQLLMGRSTGVFLNARGPPWVGGLRPHSLKLGSCCCNVRKE